MSLLNIIAAAQWAITPEWLNAIQALALRENVDPRILAAKFGVSVEAMQALHKQYPELTTLDLVGYSEEDRAIYALTISNPNTGDHLSKPGVYVDGNIHGNEVQADLLADAMRH